jgi:hypothetical protein
MNIIKLSVMVEPTNIVGPSQPVNWSQPMHTTTRPNPPPAHQLNAHFIMSFKNDE